MDSSAFNGWGAGLDLMFKLLVSLVLIVPVLLAIIAYLLVTR